MRLGPYEVIAHLGAGGMGEVYRARDTRLDRTVAIKVLPASLVSDPDRRARFEREAKAISSLNHPHICTLHDVGHQDGIDYLVMEYVEGQSLAERLTRGSLSLERALRVGAEMAEALDRAHSQGIVHRDLKPGNVMLTKSGVKLLDFGLAKLRADGVVPAGTLSALATAEKPLTGEGTLLGTLPYMAPEQLEGKEADHRSDIWSLGAVMYEMVTGQRAFEAKSQASLIAAILEREPPPLANLQPMSPPALERAVKTCLAKDPDRRWQSAADLGRELGWIAEGLAAPAVSPSGPGVRAVRPDRRIAPALATAATLLLGGMIGIALMQALRRRAAPVVPEKTARFLLSAPEGAAFAGDLAVSPQGRHLVFTATASGVTTLWLRSLDRVLARRMPGTEGARFPFWSQDERFVAFFAEGRLKKVPIAGGPPEVLCQTSVDPRGGSWSSDGVIVFAPHFGSGLQRVPASGGDPVALTELDHSRSERSHRWPQFLPDGRFLFFVLAGTGPGTLYAGSLDGKVQARPLGIHSPATYSRGYLLFARDRTLLAQAFDVQGLVLSGEPVTIADNLLYDRHSEGLWYFSASVDGQLAYRTGTTFTELVWVDRAGNTLDTVAPAADYSGPQVSPDGSRLAVQRIDPRLTNSDIWLFDLGRKVGSRFTYDPADDGAPVWSPDGTRIMFSSNRAGRNDMYEKDTGGEAGERLVLRSEQFKMVDAWSPDGQFVIYRTMHPTNRLDLMVSPSAGGSSVPFLATPFSEEMADFAPDGRWVTYASDESGRYEVYVRPFEPPGSGSSARGAEAGRGKWQISINGGWTPGWSRDGREIFYLAENGDLMTVPISLVPRFSAGSPRRLFAAGVDATAVTREYDVSADGRRFLLNRRVEADRPQPLTVELDWAAELKR